MPSLFPISLQSLRVGISLRTITLLRVERRWRKETATVLADARLPVDAAHDARTCEALTAELRSALKNAECRRMRTHVVLSDDLVRHFMVTPPKNAGRLRDCRAAGQMRFQALYGEPASAWRIEADWDARNPFLACAMPADFLHAVHAALKEQDLALAGLTSQFVAAWNRWHRKLLGDAWFGVVHDRGVTVGAVGEGRLQAVRPLSLDAAQEGLDAARLRHMLAREALLLNLPTPARLQLTGAPLDRMTSMPADALACEDLDQTHGAAGAARQASSGLALVRTGMRT